VVGYFNADAFKVFCPYQPILSVQVAKVDTGNAVGKAKGKSSTKRLDIDGQEIHIAY